MTAGLGEGEVEDPLVPSDGFIGQGEHLGVVPLAGLSRLQVRLLQEEAVEDDEVRLGQASSHGRGRLEGVRVDALRYYALKGNAIAAHVLHQAGDGSYGADHTQATVGFVFSAAAAGLAKEEQEDAED